MTSDRDLARLLDRARAAEPPPIEAVLDAPRRRVRPGIALPLAALAAAAVAVLVAVRPASVAAPPPAVAVSLWQPVLPGAPDLLEADRIAQRILAIRTEQP